MGIFLVGLGCLGGGQAGTWRSVFCSIQKGFLFVFICFEIPVCRIFIAPCNNKLKTQSRREYWIHDNREGRKQTLVMACHDWRPEVIIKKHTLWPLQWTKGRKHSERNWDSLMKPHFFAVIATCLSFFSVRRGGRGLPGGTVAQEECRGGKWWGSGFASPEERRCPRCLRSQQALPPFPLSPRCLLRKTNPRKPKQNKLPSPPPKYI